MKIAVASQNKSKVTEHTGKCQKFWIYEVNSQEVLGKELLELSPDQSFYNSSPYEPHPLDNVQVLISGKIGRGLMRRLEKQGIAGIVTLESDPDLAVISYLENSLAKEISKPHNCRVKHQYRLNYQYRHKHANNYN
ncbi:Dinitrogenase iron-molybdenum cofactor biosynthesis protein [Hyella patelloides LEGE 07179]|uniref:Dinitrogenase iron-molybdenum cofactor biosynthesis protein n=1 Tax=Hyella patelloides LEGE 07179 TaxID=945734 RepID=A0A563VP66_9CYAN|nr:NifB/NifX family molybdenum-iron cluster-binding protein [Hyella patelloides]VEP13075.1 Dinitrogenase iron-molybdenum cofactor biosynthesis protein [Hyella patelloides LEGE 07179]